MLLLAGIAIYLLTTAGLLVAALIALLLDMLPPTAAFMKLALMCCTVAGIAGCLYCIRAIYINKCVCMRWDPDWTAWYLLRPMASIMSGGASYLFLKAGLLILESKEAATSSDTGFLALAFVAGLNVDKFLGKLESIAQAVWGIDKSRASNLGEEKNG